MWRFAISVAVLMMAGEAGANAWPRGTGNGFVSLGYEITGLRDDLTDEGRARDPSPDVNGYGTLYAELGLSPRVTAGLDFGWDEAFLTDRINDEVERRTKAATGLTGAELAAFDATDRRVLTWDRIAFLRAAIGPLDANHRFAVQLGLGFRSYEQQGIFFGLEEMKTEPIVRPALAYGYGFGGETYSGWVSALGSVEFRADTGGQVVKLDATAGVKPSEGRSMYLFSVQSGQYPDADPYVRLVPGIVVRLLPHLSLENSFLYGVRGDNRVGTKIALWVEW